MTHDPLDFDSENVTGKYILDDEGEPVAEPHLIKWAMWMESHERIVLRTYVGKQTVVSTVFLGLDYSFNFPGDTSLPASPVLWETMVFGKRTVFQNWGRRYASKLDALAGHMRMCELVERFGDQNAPRRLKKAMHKVVDDRRRRPGEQQRLERWHAKVAEFTARHPIP